MPTRRHSAWRPIEARIGDTIMNANHLPLTLYLGLLVATIPSLPVDLRVADLLSRTTLEEKIAQGTAPTSSSRPS